MKYDHEIHISGPGLAGPKRLSDALLCANNGHTTRVEFASGNAVYVLPEARYRELCELEQPGTEDRICRHCKRAIVASAASRDWALRIPDRYPVLFCPDSPADLQLHEPVPRPHRARIDKALEATQ